MTKNLTYYLDLDYTVRVLASQDKKTFFAEIEELPGCFTEADTPAEALAQIEDAKKAWLEVALEQGMLIPEPNSDTYSGKLNIRLPKSLHRQLAYQAKEEGTSLNTLITTKLSLFLH